MATTPKGWSSMHFTVDENGTVLVDGEEQDGYSVAANIGDIPDIVVTMESLVFAGADPDRGTHAGAKSMLLVTHNGVTHQIDEVAAPQEVGMPTLEAFAQRIQPRKAIIAWMFTAGSDDKTIELAAVESRFNPGRYIATQSFS